MTADRDDSYSHADLLWWLQKLRSDAVSRSTLRGMLVPDHLRPLGHFHLESVLGTGSYSAVVRALDTCSNRPVALKIAWLDVIFHDESNPRFLDEPQAVPHADHDGIVRVFESGNIGVVYYISFELIEGPTLAEWFAEKDYVQVRDAARIVQLAAEAAHVAHEHGVVHRDLKPSNILVRPVPSAGFPFQPVLTDFGLAHRTSEDKQGSTATNARVGTNRYMSPEQASGDSKNVKPTADVFSLGVILYELVTGARPFDGETEQQTLDRIQHEEPPSIRSWRRSIPRDIETILLKCLEKSPAARYSSAAELADDLGRFLNRKRIVARRVPLWRRTAKFVGRHPVAIAASTFGILAGLAITAVLGGLIAERRMATERAETMTEAAATEDVLKRQHQYATLIRHAARSSRFGNGGNVSQYLKDAQAIAHGEVQVGLEWNLLSAMADNSSRALKPELENVRHVRFSPNNDLLVCAGRGGVVFYETKNWTRIATFVDKKSVICAEFSADGTHLAIGNQDGRLIVLRVSDQAIMLDSQVLPNRISCLQWIGGSPYVAAGGKDAVVAVVHTTTGETKKTQHLEPSEKARSWVPPIDSRIFSLAYIPDRNVLAVLVNPAELFLFNPTTLEQVDTWECSPSRNCLCHVPYGEQYLATCGANSLQLLSAMDGAIVRSHDLSQIICDVRYSPTTKLLVGAFADGSVQAWKIEHLLNNSNALPDFRFVGLEDTVASSDVSSDGRRLAASSSSDPDVRVWDQPIAGAAPETSMADSALWACFSSDGKWFALGQWKIEGIGVMSVFDTADGKKKWSTRLLRPPVIPSKNERPPIIWPTAFHPDGQSIVIPEEDGSVTLRACVDGAILQRLDLGNVASTSFFFHPNGQEILAINPREARIVNAMDGTVQHSIPNESRGAQSQMAVTRSSLVWLNKTVVEQNRIIQLKSYPADTGLESWEYNYSEDTFYRSIECMAIAPDCHYLAGADYKMNIHLWDLKSDEPPHRMITPERIWALSFSNDGQTLIGEGASGTFTFWHVPTKSELFTLGSAEEKVTCLAIHPRDAMVVLGIQQGDGYSLRVYRLGEEGQRLTAAFEVE